MKYLPLTLAFIAPFLALCQQGIIKGSVIDENNNPIPQATILLKSNTKIGTISNVSGKFELQLPVGNQILIFTHVQYQSREFWITVEENAIHNLQATLLTKRTVLDEVEIIGEPIKDPIDPASKIDSRAATQVPSAFGDFSQVLVTLPGVVSNNELSSAYNVRGGNFDENLVYVNDIPIYRPFLANAGRQEGLSFINTYLVDDIRFYAGGWESKYGDKLSSSLNILYKEPQELQGNMSIGLLGGSAYAGNQVSEKIKYLFGARHRDSRYLLNTLGTEGQYFPSYTDVQTFLTFDLSGNSHYVNRTKLNWLTAYGRNRYLTIPESQITEFGSISQTLRIKTDFKGRELLNYDTYQSGINLSHRWNHRFLSQWIASAVYTTETEFFNVEGAYRICNIENNADSSDPNDCVVTRGIGTNFDYGRNKLKATLWSMEWRNEMVANRHLLLEAGMGINQTHIDDEINEYAYIDSAGFIVNPFDATTNLLSSIFNKLELKTTTLTGYLQTTTFSADSLHALNAGIRINHMDYTHQTLVSPRMIYRYKTPWEQETSFRIMIGQYPQPPFYRELRDLNGNIQKGIKAQKSTHFIIGMERLLHWWNRPFLLTTEAYYKRLTDVIPYDVDNVRLRYFANNSAKAFAYGLDIRLNGEFIQGAQSWFSLGLLNTKENLAEDNKEYIRRPTDQHFNLAFFFEDHIPTDPTLRVYVNSVFGSGFPIGPPNDLNARNTFSGDNYFKVDMGFSKSFQLKNHKYLKTIWLRAEILNALGAINTLSYSWIQDINGNQLAIPNSLIARFLNIRIVADF